jgi:hypothetical protein
VPRRSSSSPRAALHSDVLTPLHHGAGDVPARAAYGCAEALRLGQPEMNLERAVRRFENTSSAIKQKTAGIAIQWKQALGSSNAVSLCSSPRCGCGFLRGSLGPCLGNSGNEQTETAAPIVGGAMPERLLQSLLCAVLSVSNTLA